MLRVLIAEHPENPEYSLALEEALYHFVARLGSPPIRRIGRHRNAIILGYFQRAEEEVDLDKAQQLNVRVVRRLTGGGAVYHDYGCLLWSIITRGPVDGGVNYVYGYLLRGFIDFLRNYADVRVENVNDIVIYNRKVSGTAATFDRKGAYLLHGTLLLKTNLQLMSQLLRVPKIKLQDKGVTDVKYRVANLYELLGREIELQVLIEKLIEAYSKLLGEKPVIDLPSEKEYVLADYLYETKYSKREWNYERKRIDVRIEDAL
jgi:lipoate-protein ligase A